MSLWSRRRTVATGVRRRGSRLETLEGLSERPVCLELGVWGRSGRLVSVGNRGRGSLSLVEDTGYLESGRHEGFVGGVVARGVSRDT